MIVLAGESCRFNKLSEPALDCALNNYFRTKNVENTVLKPPLEGRCPALAGRRGDLTRVKYLFSITSIINILHYLSFKRVFNNDKKDIFKILDPHKEYGLLSSIQNKLQITPNHIWRNDYE